MAFTPSRSRNANEQQRANSKPTGLLLELQENHSETCRWSASNSTATPSETASSHGEASPRQAALKVRASSESVQTEGLTRLVRPEMDDAPLGDMFEDSDGEACPLSPSKSARRRLRRRRQRDALKAALLDRQQGDELEKQATRRWDSKEHTRSRSVVTLAEIGFELDGCNTTAEETPQAFLVATPMHHAPCTPGVLSTSPCSESPATVTSMSLFRTVPLRDASNRHLKSTTTHCTAHLSDASNRHLPAMTTQFNALGQSHLSASPCASNRVALGPTLTSPSASMTSNATNKHFLASGLVASSPCSPSRYPIPATMPAPANVESLSASPEERRTADTLRMLLSISTLTSGGDIVATLNAAAPEIYED